jgi:hypothetical protein
VTETLKYECIVNVQGVWVSNSSHHSHIQFKLSQREGLFFHHVIVDEMNVKRTCIKSCVRTLPWYSVHCIPAVFYRMPHKLTPLYGYPWSLGKTKFILTAVTWHALIAIRTWKWPSKLNHFIIYFIFLAGTFRSGVVYYAILLEYETARKHNRFPTFRAHYFPSKTYWSLKTRPLHSL